MKLDGFVNTDVQEISNAKVKDFDTCNVGLQRGKIECTVEWDSFEVSFDNEANVWMVSFYTEEILGGDQSVYLDSNGKTLLIVYGE